MSRMIGSLDVDNGSTTFFDYATETFAARNTYEQHVLAGGLLTRTRKDQVAVVITVQGYFEETAGLRWAGFADALLALDGAPVNLGNGIKYAQCDVIDAIPQPVGVVGESGGEKLRMYRYSARLQCYSGTRVP